MSDRKEYHWRYLEKRKEKMKENYLEKRKEKMKENYQEKKEEKRQKLREEYEKTVKENPWFDRFLNRYVYKLNSEENERYSKELKKRFNLLYDIKYLEEREKGDSKKYLREREEKYREILYEEDLGNRYQLWELFREYFTNKFKFILQINLNLNQD